MYRITCSWNTLWPDSILELFSLCFSRNALQAASFEGSSGTGVVSCIIGVVAALSLCGSKGSCGFLAVARSELARPDPMGWDPMRCDPLRVQIRIRAGFRAIRSACLWSRRQQSIAGERILLASSNWLSVEIRIAARPSSQPAFDFPDRTSQPKWSSS